MHLYFLWGSVALCLVALGLLARRDWLRLTRPACRALARVTGHRASWSDNARVYAAILQFTHDGTLCEVVDQLFSSQPKPPVGTEVEVRWPEGHPELARPPRVIMWLVVYAFLIGTAAAIFAKAMGWPLPMS